MMGRLHNTIVIAAFAVVAAVPRGSGPFPGPMPGPGPGPVSGLRLFTQRAEGELGRPTTPKSQPGSIQRDIYCELNPSPGECQAAFPRYYYNSTTSQCDCYLFGDCDEEEGSYRSLEECHRRCLPNLKEEGPTCRLVYIDNVSPFSHTTTTNRPTTVSGRDPFPGPVSGPGPFPGPESGPGSFPSPGSGPGPLPGVHIPQTERVSGFQSTTPHSQTSPDSTSTRSTTHSGLRPVTGGQLWMPTTPKSQPGSVQRDVSCGLNPSPGECQAAFPRYYYNSTTSQCDCYLFGGCDEEEGSYRSLEECHRRCLPNLKEEGPTCRLVYIDNFSPSSPPTTTSRSTTNNRPATTRQPPTTQAVFPGSRQPSSGGPSSTFQTTTFQPTGNRLIPAPLVPSESAISPFGDRKPTIVKTTGNRPTPVPLFPPEIPRVPLNPHVTFPDDGRHPSDLDNERDYDD